MTTAALDYGIAPTGYRLPAATRVGSVRLQVSDLQRSIDYYTQVLGLRAVGRETAAADLAAHGDDWPLVRLQARPGIQAVPSRGAFGLYHFAILLPDRAALGRFVTHLAAIGVRVGAADHLVSEALYLTDPDGLGIEVYADRPRDTWRHANRELAMASDPLDVVSLGAAAPGRAVDGRANRHHHGAHAPARRRSRRGAAFLPRRARLRRDRVELPRRALLLGRGLSPSSGHQHVGARTAATDAQARLVDWELVLPHADDAAAAAGSLKAAGYRADHDGTAWTALDPWGTRVVLRAP